MHLAMNSTADAIGVMIHIRARPLFDSFVFAMYS